MAELDEEKKCIEECIQERETLLVKHNEKVENMISMKAKEMSKFLSLITKAEDEKHKNFKEMETLDQEIAELQNKIQVIEEEKSRMRHYCTQKDEQIEKFDRKRQKLEKYMEEEMERTKEEGKTINDQIEEFKAKLDDNAKRTEELYNVEALLETR